MASTLKITSLVSWFKAISTDPNWRPKQFAKSTWKLQHLCKDCSNKLFNYNTNSSLIGKSSTDILLISTYYIHVQLKGTTKRNQCRHGSSNNFTCKSWFNTFYTHLLHRNSTRKFIKPEIDSDLCAKILSSVLPHRQRASAVKSSSVADVHHVAIVTDRYLVPGWVLDLTTVKVNP